MGRPMKQAQASKKSHNTRASKASKKPDFDSRVSKPTALKKKDSSKADKKPRADDRRADNAPTEKCTQQDQVISDSDFSQLLKVYREPTNEEEARARMSEALWLHQWHLTAYYLKDETSKKVRSDMILRCTIGTDSMNSADCLGLSNRVYCKLLSFIAIYSVISTQQHRNRHRKVCEAAFKSCRNKQGQQNDGRQCRRKAGKVRQH